VCYHDYSFGGYCLAKGQGLCEEIGLCQGTGVWLSFAIAEQLQMQRMTNLDMIIHGWHIPIK
jgi:hypothetical protein